MSELEEAFNGAILEMCFMLFVLFVIPVTILAVVEEKKRIAGWYRWVFPVKGGGSK